MPKLAAGELSKHPSKGYRLTCGTYVAPDGKRRPKVFWLGSDKNKALLDAARIRWYAWVAAAEGGWNPGLIARMKATDTISLVRQRYVEAELTRQRLAPHIAPEVVVHVHPAVTPQQNVAAPLAPPARAAMLHAALDSFVAAVRQKQTLSRSHRKTISDSITALKHYRQDCPLADLDYAWLEGFTAELRGRPLSRRKDRLTGRYLPIKPYTVRRLLQHLRQALQWISRQHESPRFGGWRAPSEWRELFSVELKQLMNKAERDRAADGPEQLTIDEIRRLYQAASRSRGGLLHPILFLTGLFAGLGQTELSTARRDEFNLDTATFTHRRNKTGQQGVYWLPPELVALLRKYFKEQPEDPSTGLAFRTLQGRALVTDASDAVRQAWDDWRDRAKLVRPGLGFYSLRRFFGDYATRNGGDAVGDAALAHTAKSVRGRHYSGYRDFARVWEVSRRLHAELKSAGVFSQTPKSA